MFTLAPTADDLAVWTRDGEAVSAPVASAAEAKRTLPEGCELTEEDVEIMWLEAVGW